MLHLSFGELTVVSAICAILIPLGLFFIFDNMPNKFKLCVLLLYVVFILYEVIFNRSVSELPRFNFRPFWSYSGFSQPGMRWQIYMNVFLFIPFGFLLPWSLKRGFFFSVFVGFVFSFCVELSQLVFRLGFCEIDDIIHNTLGCIIGFMYYLLLIRIKSHNNKNCQEMDG